MKVDKLPLCEINSAVQNKLVQAHKEVKMLQSQQQFSHQVSNQLPFFNSLLLLFLWELNL